jgi:hypothetical protein
MRKGSARFGPWLAVAVLIGLALVVGIPRLLEPLAPDDAEEPARREARRAHPSEASPMSPAPAPASARRGGERETEKPETAPGSPRVVVGGSKPGPDPTAGTAPDASPAEVRLARDPVTNRPIEVAPGASPEIEIDTLKREGLPAVSGTMRVTGEREADVDAGLPVGLTGRVIEKESKQPIEGAVVLVHSTFYVRSIFYDHHLEEVARVETDADGKFLIDRLNVDPVHFGKCGRAYLSVRSHDHAPLLSLPLPGVRTGYRNRLPDLVLSRERHTVRGRVIDYWENEPVAGGRVVATGEIHPIHYPKDQRDALFLSAPECTTDEKGRFVLENVGPGKQMLSVHGGDDCAGYLEIEVPRKGEVIIRTRQIRGRIQGRVEDEWGRPIALVRVDGGQNTTHTFADGTFLLENFRGDVVTLAFAHADYRPATKTDVPDGSLDVTVRLASRWPLVRFRVRDRDRNEPVPVVAIRLEFADEARPAVPASPFFISAAGVHAVRVPVGTVRATVEAEGYATTEVDVTGLIDGAVRDVVLVRKQ